MASAEQGIVLSLFMSDISGINSYKFQPDKADYQNLVQTESESEGAPNGESLQVLITTGRADMPVDVIALPPGGGGHSWCTRRPVNIAKSI